MYMYKNNNPYTNNSYNNPHMANWGRPYYYGGYANPYEHGAYSLRTSSIDIESQTKKQQLAKEIKANIPKRALMLEKASEDISSLPQLPSVLWKEIAEYEGGVESSVLGQVQDSSISIGSCCNIL